MAERITSNRAQADHYRALARWTSDERTHRILLQMARELDTGPVAELAPACDSPVQDVPRSLS